MFLFKENILIEHGTYKNNKPTGKWKVYYNSGKILKEFEYADTLIKPSNYLDLKTVEEEMFGPSSLEHFYITNSVLELLPSLVSDSQSLAIFR